MGEGHKHAVRSDGVNTLSSDLDFLTVQFAQDLNTHTLRAGLGKVGDQIVAENGRRTQALIGISRRQDLGLGAQVDAFQDRNIALIKSLGADQIQDLRDTLSSAELGSMRVEDLRALIEERFDVSQSRADLIARDQTLKLNGQVTMARQTGAGIESYVWTTAGDDRVRDEHDAQDGETFSWDDPPPTGHPGDDFQCRCTAFPVITAFDASGAETEED